MSDFPSPRKDVIAVLGTTGTGKSQLSISLAQSLSLSHDDHLPYRTGEVINADSMQVYHGLDVLTNKVSEEEMDGVKHHLMSFLEIGEDYTVERFRKDAAGKIDEIHSRSNLPLIVGGTSYYVQNLLLPGRLVKDVASDLPGAGKDLSRGLELSASELQQVNHVEVLQRYSKDLASAFKSLPEPLLELTLLLPSLPPFSSPSAFPPHFPVHLLPSTYRPPQRTAEDFALALYEALGVVDPKMAQTRHWRDVRKVRRCLEVAVCSGKRMSEVVEEQEQAEREGDSNVPYRTLIFWLWADLSVLNDRLDSRVDKMMEAGLLDEVKHLRRLRVDGTSGSDTDFSRGPYQAIGYRELDAYLKSTSAAADDAPRLSAALDLMKLSTRQYAKAQVKWMKGKLAPEVGKLSKAGADVEIFLLDATNLAEWDENVGESARSIMHSFLRHEPLRSPDAFNAPSSSILAPALASKLLATSTSRAMRVCDVCTVDPERPLVMDQAQWETHMKSQRHRKRLRGSSNPYQRVDKSSV